MSPHHHLIKSASPHCVRHCTTGVELVTGQLLTSRIRSSDSEQLRRGAQRVLRTIAHIYHTAIIDGPPWCRLAVDGCEQGCSTPCLANWEDSEHPAL